MFSVCPIEKTVFAKSMDDALIGIRGIQKSKSRFSGQDRRCFSFLGIQ